MVRINRRPEMIDPVTSILDDISTLAELDETVTEAEPVFASDLMTYGYWIVKTVDTRPLENVLNRSAVGDILPPFTPGRISQLVAIG